MKGPKLTGKTSKPIDIIGDIYARGGKIKKLFPSAAPMAIAHSAFTALPRDE